MAPKVGRSRCIGLFCLATCASLGWQLRFAGGRSDVEKLLSFVNMSYPETLSYSLAIMNELNRSLAHGLHDSAITHKLNPTIAYPQRPPSKSTATSHEKRNGTIAPIMMPTEAANVKPAHHRGRRGRKEKRSIPVGQMKVPTPVFVLSLPKSGTTSMYMYFNCGGIWSMHTYSKVEQNKVVRIGRCMEDNFKNRRPILEGCGSQDTFSDLGYIGGGCFYPSLQAVDSIIRDYPNSTLIVTYRSSGWHDSITKYNGLKQRWRKHCDVFPNSTDPNVWEDFYAQHRRRIREAVQGHPTLRYLEFDLKDPTAGYQLENFTGISHKCYGNCKPNFVCTYDS